MVPTADEGWFSDLEGIFLCRCAGQYKAWPGEDLAFGTPPRGGARYRFTMPWGSGSLGFLVQPQGFESALTLNRP